METSVRYFPKPQRQVRQLVLAYNKKFEIAGFWRRPNAEGNVNIGLGGNHEGLGSNPPLTPIMRRFV
jgi:hypothetical protein